MVKQATIKQVSYRHWQLKKEDSGVLWLVFSRADHHVNTIDTEVLQELEHILDDIIQTQGCNSIIIASGKESGFIAGADLTALRDAQVSQVIEIVRKGQQVFDKLAHIGLPTVAMIDGFCLGGGLELALACRYRVAEEGTKTYFAAPEVRLGIQPGWGGTVRLPPLVGPLAAMDIMLSGRNISAKAAAKIGLVDAAVPLRQLKRAALYYAQHAPEPHHPAWWQSLLTIPPFRQMTAGLLRRKLTAKVDPDYYPAPYAIVDSWGQEGTSGQKGLANEVSSFGKLLQSDTARNLVRVFFLREQLKGLSKANEFPVRSVHVIGAGAMGGDIAACCALHGMHVTLQDQKVGAIALAMKRAYDLLSRKLKTPRLIQEAMDRLMPDVNGLGVAKADLIIEAIFENLEVKRALFKKLETEARSDAIFATNTSTIPIDEISTALEDPKRLVGIHFFNPVALMPLVEVVSGVKTSAEVVKKAMAFVGQIDKLPLPVKSSPGFLVNRILMPYLMESILLADEGVPLAAIDQAAKNFGMPMGPVELSDTVGLDVCLAAARILTEHLGGTVPERLVKMVDQGLLGKKSGQGFYHYQNGKAKKEPLPSNYVIDKEISHRLINRMIKEAEACLREGVVENPDLLDAGMIFGSGFPPFRGGLLEYAKGVAQMAGCGQYSLDTEPAATVN